MIRSRSLRLSWFGDAGKVVLDDFHRIAVEAVALLPIPVSLEVHGSFARGVADLASELDLHVATGRTERERQAALKTLREHPQEWQDFKDALREIRNTYGVVVDVSLEEPAIKLNPKKRCYDLLEQKWYGLENPKSKKRWKKTKDGQWVERPERGPLPISFLGEDYTTKHAMSNG